MRQRKQGRYPLHSAVAIRVRRDVRMVAQPQHGERIAVADVMVEALRLNGGRVDHCPLRLMGGAERGPGTERSPRLRSGRPPQARCRRPDRDRRPLCTVGVRTAPAEPASDTSSSGRSASAVADPPGPVPLRPAGRSGRPPLGLGCHDRAHRLCRPVPRRWRTARATPR